MRGQAARCAAVTCLPTPTAVSRSPFPRPRRARFEQAPSMSVAGVRRTAVRPGPACGPDGVDRCGAHIAAEHSRRRLDLHLHADGRDPLEMTINAHGMAETDPGTAVMTHTDRRSRSVVGCTIQTVHVLLLIGAGPSLGARVLRRRARIHRPRSGTTLGCGWRTRPATTSPAPRSTHQPRSPTPRPSPSRRD